MIVGVVVLAFFAGFGMGMIYGYLRLWRKLDRAPGPRHVCGRCGKRIEGNDYRYRGIGVGDRSSEDGLVYEHFPECPS